MALSMCFFVLISIDERVFSSPVCALTGVNTDILNLDSFYAGIFDLAHMLSFKQY